MNSLRHSLALITGTFALGTRRTAAAIPGALALCVTIALGSACAPAGPGSEETTDEDLGEESEDTGTATDAIISGTWVSSFPPNPVYSSGSLPLPVCRVRRGTNDYHPGKWWMGECLYEWNGTGWRSSNPPYPVEFLVNNGYSWSNLTSASVPNNAVSGGLVPGGATTVCAALVSGQYHPGKLWYSASDGLRCRIELGGAGQAVMVPPGWSWDGWPLVKSLVQ